MSEESGGAEARYMFKVILIGDGSVGKTSLVRKYMEGKFKIDYLPTIGSQVYTKTIASKETTRVKLVLWDISGQPAFNMVRPDYYKGAQGILLVFDLTKPRTFENLDGWINETKRHVSNPAVILIGNKSDLEHERKIPLTSGEAYASKLRGSYLETSAKDGKNVEKAFTTIAESLVRKIASSHE